MVQTPIAIVGIGCRFPGGITTAQRFWDVIASGVDAIGDVPPDRWRAADFHDPDAATPGRMIVRQGGFLREPVDEFDAGFFGLAPREAAAVDPQQRLLLEVAWEAFEDAGIPPASVAGTDVGAYIGGFTFDAATLQLGDTNRHLVSAATPTGVSMTMLAARLSYTFDWRGPSLTLDTACSSSLVAFHHACAALARGECDLAVAGGVNVMVNPVTTMLMSKGQFLSPDARCKSFDHRANGYARGEGAGLVLLKPLPAALNDGDHIYAVVRGTAVNQDGRTPGVTVPSADAQRTLIHRACRLGGVEPGSVGYFEAHGTGTAVGDPIEAVAIGEALGDSALTHWIGSVKSNIGHTEAAAGVAGVIKASLCLERGLVPPNLHFERPNPAIPFDRLPLRVPTAMVPFPAMDGPRRAGVNSFGFGGTNAHAVLEQAPVAANEPGEDDGRLVVLPLSARSPQALRALADGYAEYLENGPALRRVGRAAARGRDHHAIRAFVVAGDRAEAAKLLRELAIASTRTRQTAAVFVYTGMGPQWWGMGRELLLEEPRFAEVVAECDDLLAREGLSIRAELLRAESESRLTETLYAQIANFVVQAGLTALWRDRGIVPAAIVGHSVGEVAAAYAAGVYSLQDALTVSFHRARLQSGLAGRGAMAAVALPAEEIDPYLVDGVCVAAVNSTSATTVAGDHDALNAVIGRLTADDVSVRRLRVEVAYHSPQMDEIREPLLDALRAITPRPAQTALFSTVTGDRVVGTELDAGYWWDNVRQPVRFGRALRRLLAETPGAVLEVGPHPVLATAIDEAVAESGRDTPRFTSLRRDRPQREQMLETLGQLYVSGLDPDWAAVHPGPREHLDLPRYPWQRERHWIESPASRDARLGVDGSRLAGRPVAATGPARDIELSTAALPYLTDHLIGDAVVFPGAGYLEAALAQFPDDEPCFLSGVAFHRPLVLPPSSVTTLRVEHDPASGRVTLHGRSRPDDAWTLHAELTRTHLARPRSPEPRADTLADLTRGLTELSRDDVYERLHGSDLHYGPAFQAVDRLWCRADTHQVYAELRLDTVDQVGHRLHPVVLDAALQAAITGAALVGGAEVGTYVPATIGELRFFRPPGKTLWVHGRDRRSPVSGRIECDLTLITDDGAVVAEMIGLRAQRLADDRPQEEHHLQYEHTWRPEPAEPEGDAEGGWIVVGSSATANALTRALGERGGTAVRVDGLGATATAGRGVVFVHDPADVEAPVCTPVEAALRLVQELPVAGGPLTLVTRGAQSTGTTDPAASALWGFGRVVSAERPELRCRLVDIDPAVPGDDERMVDALVDELIRGGLDEVTLRGATRYVRRLEPAGDGTPLRNVRVQVGATAVRLRSRPGEDPRFAAVTRREPGPAEVEIEVAYVGLNFKDVLKATGLLAPYALEGSHSQSALGLECSGTVARVGIAVTDLHPGDQVFAHSRDLFGSYVTLDAVRVMSKPPSLSLAQAASLLPVATAALALTELARVRAGERVLIHSAAGGVGLAAVRLAKHLGAEVYATAGSEQRRELLHREGVTHVADSRSTSFADDILAWTGGAGVDVVLSSLPGEMLPHSLRVLRTFGRFVELGKPANTADHTLRTESARRALSFHSVDYDQMMALAPDRVRECMRATTDLALAPLPVTEVPADEVDEAFRIMGRAGHTGKVVVRMAGASVTVPADSLPGAPVRPDATYVITGGLGGLGRTVARWFADCGARHLVLISRGHTPAPEADRLTAELTAEGVTVRVERADVTDREQVAAVLDRTRALMPPIRGLLHAAAGFDDLLLSDTTPDRLIEATRPKADGAWNLHLETAADDLDFFVLFSSVAAQLGAAGAGAYATANEFLNGLARHRADQGLPATSIGWGMINDVGVAVSRDGYVGSVLRRNGHIGMSPARLLTELRTLLHTRPIEASVAHIDWPRWARANPQLAALPRVRDNVPAGAADDDGRLSAAQRLRTAGPAERAALLPALIAPVLRGITGLTDDQLAGDQPVDIDSLTAVELRVLLQKELGVMVPAVKLQRTLTLTGLATLLAGELGASADPPRPDLTVHEFPSADGLTVFGHLSLPAGPGPHPAVVVCTAGEGGALDADGTYVKVSEHAPLHAAGFAVFTVDHRGAPGHGADFHHGAAMGGADIDDVIAAARFLAARPDIDGARVSIVGTSRGAYSALLALERAPALWHRAALLLGFYDPAVLVAAERSRPGSLLPSATSDAEEYFAAANRQPLTSLPDVTAPLLIVHGDADRVIPLSEAQRLTDLAQQIGLPVRLLTVPGLGHDSDHAGVAWTTLWPEITDFL
ncbi:SDR family NAD(P)-dependent oxidoreductase [Micromonospora sp. NPDC004704]